MNSISNAGKKKILIIEDDTNLLLILNHLFSKDYDVSVCNEGDGAVEMIKRIKPDLIICDLNLPGEDGLSITHKVKNDETLSHIPILILTSDNSKDNRTTAFENYADQYVLKPFEPLELKARVTSLLVNREKIKQQSFTNNFLAFSPLRDSYHERTQLLEKINEVIERNLSNQGFRITTLAKEIAMSVSTLERRMKEIGEESPKNYIRKYRLLKALNMIKKNEFAIKEVAQKCGFKSLSYFSQVFSKEFGQTPSSVK